MGTPLDQIPGVGRPFRDAVKLAGYTDLESLNGADYRELLELHGVGKAGLRTVHDALMERGLGGLVGDIPEAKGSTWTKGHTGENAADIKTAQTSQDPEEWIESLEWPARVKQGKELLKIFSEATGEQGVMWGPSMVGYESRPLQVRHRARRRHLSCWLQPPQIVPIPLRAPGSPSQRGTPGQAR